MSCVAIDTSGRVFFFSHIQLLILQQLLGSKLIRYEHIGIMTL